MVESLRSLIRWREWGHSKIPPLFAAGSAWMLAQPPGPRALARFIAWVVFAALFLAYGYAVNDYFDAEADRRAVKPNAISKLGRRAGLVSLAVMVGAGAFALFPFYGERWVTLLVAVSYALASAYSMPPARFKERGSAGVLVSAAAQRSLPLLVGMALFDQFEPESWLLLTLLTLVGVRWILVHQLIDLPCDERGEVSTFTRSRGAGSVLWIIKGVIFPLEIACLLAWLFVAGKAHPQLWLMVPTYGAWLLIRLALWHGVGPAFNWKAYWLHPLGDFYEIFWPLFLAIVLAAHDPLYLLLLLFQILWQLPYLQPQLTLLHRLLRLKTHRGMVR